MLGERCIDGLTEAFDRATAGVEGIGIEHPDHRSGGQFGDHNRNAVTAGRTHSVGLVVSVERLEGHVEAADVGVPLGPTAEHPVGDVAQRTVGPTEPGTNPITHLAADGVICVVQPEQSDYLRRVVHRCTVCLDVDASPAVPGNSATRLSQR